MYYLYILTIVLLLASFFKDREKTFKALKVAYKKFRNILPDFIVMLILVSIILYLLPDRVITHYLSGQNKLIGVGFASLIGSVTLMPGFIAFPLAGILLSKGVAYMVLSAFTTTLMMVGVLTYPVEKAYFGARVTIIRNLISFFIALAVAFMIGIFFGEIF
jgi:uncharacterized membrane protein YraQ (UPF0718 family)